MSCFMRSRSSYQRWDFLLRLQIQMRQSSHLDEKSDSVGGKLGKLQQYSIPKWKKVKGYVVEC
jgi:hypothetical protein